MRRLINSPPPAPFNVNDYNQAQDEFDYQEPVRPSRRGRPKNWKLVKEEGGVWKDFEFILCISYIIRKKQANK